MQILRDVTACILGVSIILVAVVNHLQSTRIQQLERDARISANLIRMCLDSINELANPGSSITEANTVEEKR